MTAQSGFSFNDFAAAGHVAALAASNTLFALRIMDWATLTSAV